MPGVRFQWRWKVLELQEWTEPCPGSDPEGRENSCARKVWKERCWKLHGGDVGVNKTMKRAREVLFWPGMSTDVTEKASRRRRTSHMRHHPYLGSRWAHTSYTRVVAITSLQSTTTLSGQNWPCQMLSTVIQSLQHWNRSSPDMVSHPSLCKTILYATG